nr:hypothetical protein [Tanacetum cinerariifolium]
MRLYEIDCVQWGVQYLSRDEDNALVDLRKKFKKAEQERDELKLKLDKYQTSSKNLSQLLVSQTFNTTGFGYDNQVFNSTVFDCDEMFSFESDDYDYYEKKLVQKPVRNHAMRGNHQHYARMTHPHPHRHVVPTSVLTRSRLVPVTAARPVTTAGNPQHALKDKGVIDSGWSRHMTGNISYLSDFEEINRGYVTFGENP